MPWQQIPPRCQVHGRLQVCLKIIGFWKQSPLHTDYLCNSEQMVLSGSRFFVAKESSNCGKWLSLVNKEINGGAEQQGGA